MRCLLSHDGVKRLRALAKGHSLLVFDYDGTLAPITAHPDKARLRRRTKALLSKVSWHYPCAVISGRALRDVAGRVSGLNIVSIVGNHGSEWQGAMPRARAVRARVRRWARHLGEALQHVRGVWIEDKYLTLAIHYRRARDRFGARCAVERAVGELGNHRLVGGKCVVNVLPEEAPGKATALQWLLDRFKADAGMYVGDDETDESVFESAREVYGERLLTVRVGPSRHSGAEYCLNSQREVDDLLTELLRLRRPSRDVRRSRL